MSITRVIRHAVRSDAFRLRSGGRLNPRLEPLNQEVRFELRKPYGFAIPNLFIRDASVVGLSSSRAAAPSSP